MARKWIPKKEARKGRKHESGGGNDRANDGRGDNFEDINEKSGSHDSGGKKKKGVIIDGCWRESS